MTLACIATAFLIAPVVRFRNSRRATLELNELFPPRGVFTGDLRETNFATELAKRPTSRSPDDLAKWQQRLVGQRYLDAVASDRIETVVLCAPAAPEKLAACLNAFPNLVRIYLDRAVDDSTLASLAKLKHDSLLVHMGRSKISATGLKHIASSPCTDLRMGRSINLAEIGELAESRVEELHYSTGKQTTGGRLADSNLNPISRLRSLRRLYLTFDFKQAPPLIDGNIIRPETESYPRFWPDSFLDQLESAKVFAGVCSVRTGDDRLDAYLLDKHE